MTSDDEVERGARLAAVECVAEWLLAERLAALPLGTARSVRDDLLARGALMAQRRRSIDGAPVQPDEADVRHALGNLVQKAMITEARLRMQGSTQRG